MERPSGVEAGTAFSSGAPRLFGTVYGGNVAGDHYLPWRVVVGAHQHIALGALIAYALRILMRCAQQRIHGTRALVASLGHRAGANAEQGKAILFAKRLRCDKGAYLP